jgi:K+-transporting ATPase ATPase A chain
MFFGRFAHAIPILAIAGSLAAKKRAKPSAGTMPTDGPLFIGFPLAVVAIVTLLQYLPVLALGQSQNISSSLKDRHSRARR